MGRKQGVDKKESGGLAPYSRCDAVIDPTPWQVPVQGESSWFLLVSGEGSTVPFSSPHRRWREGVLDTSCMYSHGFKTGSNSYCQAKQGLYKIV
jgi:hypothetical protein